MRVLALMLALALGACAELQPMVNPVEAVTAEALAVSRAPAAEQAAALARAQQAVSGGAAIDRLRLGTLLATLPPPLRDDARAAELLGPLADASSAGLGRFAALLNGQVMERQRLARELERLSRERERVEKERTQVDQARVAADKERDKREEALKQQLEALRAIERGILEREDKLRSRKR
jgi:hypothetical protein